MSFRTSVIAALIGCAFGCDRAPASPCAPLTHGDIPYIVCTFDAAADDIRLFLNADDGDPYAHFEPLAEAVEEGGERLVFAMNAGMYLPDRRPVGLFVEDSETRAPLNLADGDSNFTLKPNGVFWTGGSQAGVIESEAYAIGDLQPSFATQSGPLLVIDGALHPAFNADGPSRFRRNGVGVMSDGRTVHFVISEIPVNFHTFASLFRDRLDTPNALYFDGRISLIYAPNLTRLERGLAMGPIVGVVEPREN